MSLCYLETDTQGEQADKIPVGWGIRCASRDQDRIIICELEKSLTFFQLCLREFTQCRLSD